MGSQSLGVLAPNDLNDADEQILDQLSEGRATPALISEQTDLGRSYVSRRLIRLAEHDCATELVRGLYELQNDPREVEA